MGELLIRRRELVLASAPTPSEWDYEWYYTDGTPSSDVWTKSGSDTPSSQSDGMRCQRAYFTKDLAITNGVIEAKFVIVKARTDVNSRRALLRIGDSTNCIYVLFHKHNTNLRIALYDGSNLMSDANTTRIGTFTWGGEYTVRININGSTGSVYINGELAKDNIDTTSMYAPGTLLWGNNQQYGYSDWQYVKYKNNAS